MRKETILNVFPSQDESHRLVVAVEQEAGSTSRLVLRQETFSEDVGWFIQSRVAIEPEQIPGLKMSLTGQAIREVRPPAREVRPMPSILSFDDAVASQVG